MSAHTPGPWAIFYDNGINVIIPAMRDGTIADMIRGDADAYLIAAAPEMLAALKLLVAFDSRAYVKQSEMAKDLLVARKAAMLAIARAEPVAEGDPS